MKKLVFSFVIAILFLCFSSCESQKKNTSTDSLPVDLQGTVNFNSNSVFDSSKVIPFFESYPSVANYKTQIFEIYQKNSFKYLWYDSQGIIEFGNALYDKIQNLEGEGVSKEFPYRHELDGIFIDEIENKLDNTEVEIMLSCMFLFYAEKVYVGIDEETVTALEWLLPKKQLSYSDLLDSVLLNNRLPDINSNTLFKQYYRLREKLSIYRQIEKNGGWKTIEVEGNFKGFRPGDTAKAILQIRDRLMLSGEIQSNNGNNKYDTELLQAIKKYQISNGLSADKVITSKLIAKMNISASERVRQIVVNMERCRWISPEIINSPELIFVNIPSFDLKFYRNGNLDFSSAVVVGKSMSKTVIFSGELKHIVFSPYWNVPKSIIEKEIKPGIAKNPNYLEQHQMEWNNGQVRQKPGKKNSLGLVKFMFPNSNDIYMHDTPSKSLFQKDSRAYSHGCIRVAKPRDLAIEILKNDENWSVSKIDAAMNSGIEKWYTISNMIPVYIGYFTALVDENGDLFFFDDVYKRDANLAKIIME